MRISKALIIAAVLVPSLSFAARLSDGKDHIKLSGKKINTTLDKGFHFSVPSPSGLYIDGEMGSIDPVKKTEKLIQFDATKAGDKPFTISFYVCDDAKTVCESHEVALKIVKKKLVKLEKEKPQMVKPETGAPVAPPADPKSVQ
ncbi:hypothetical protein ACLSU7_00205 [Bdellovibrio sp. HCB185ZH]|uniref:hypothetical protein n=1 Tax=Bdellovibrio sp. HCB185ZH TaxID=3394235 RepID=UPI0039A50037